MPDPLSSRLRSLALPKSQWCNTHGLALCFLLFATTLFAPTVHATFFVVCKTPIVNDEPEARFCWLEYYGHRGFNDMRESVRDPVGRGGGSGGSIGNPGNTVQVRDAAEKECDERAGNPIVMTTGNKIESTVDFSSAGEMGLHLRRTYNHYWTYPGLFGLHWVSSFDYSLVPQGTSVLWVQRPDGRRIKFV